MARVRRLLLVLAATLACVMPFSSAAAETVGEVTAVASPTTMTSDGHGAVPAALLPCGECDTAPVAACQATYSQDSSHEWEPGDAESPDDRGEDTHSILSNENEGGMDSCEENHGPCIPSLAWTDLKSAIDHRNASELKQVLAKAAVTVEFDSDLGAVIILGTCSSDKEPRIIAQVLVSPASVGYWTGPEGIQLLRRAGQ